MALAEHLLQNGAELPDNLDVSHLCRELQEILPPPPSSAPNEFSVCAGPFWHPRGPRVLVGDISEPVSLTNANVTDNSLFRGNAGMDEQSRASHCWHQFRRSG
jgi:hypothetical protein